MYKFVHRAKQCVTNEISYRPGIDPFVQAKGKLERYCLSYRYVIQGFSPEPSSLKG